MPSFLHRNSPTNTHPSTDIDHLPMRAPASSSRAVCVGVVGPVAVYWRHRPVPCNPNHCIDCKPRWVSRHPGSGHDHCFVFGWSIFRDKCYTGVRFKRCALFGNQCNIRYSAPGPHPSLRFCYYSGPCPPHHIQWSHVVRIMASLPGTSSVILQTQQQRRHATPSHVHSVRLRL